jgi:hypothetical protein
LSALRNWKRIHSCPLDESRAIALQTTLDSEESAWLVRMAEGSAPMVAANWRLSDFDQFEAFCDCSHSDFRLNVLA